MTHAEPRIETRDIDAELASEWLGRNIRNRPVKWRKVDQYARDISAGRWQLTGDAIRFDTSGRLIDGQNRLHAVVQADTPIRTIVMWDLDPDTQDAMDSGAARTAGDVLTMTGVANGQAIAAAARIAMALEAGHKVNGLRLTNTEVQRWVMDNLDITEAPALLGRDAKLIPLTPAIRLFAVYRLAKIDRDAAAEFFTQLATGVGLTEDSPILALRRRLGGASYGATRKTNVEEQVSAVFRTWNAWRAGRPLARVLTTNRAGVTTIPDPI